MALENYITTALSVSSLVEQVDLEQRLSQMPEDWETSSVEAISSAKKPPYAARQIVSETNRVLRSMRYLYSDLDARREAQSLTISDFKREATGLYEEHADQFMKAIASSPVTQCPKPREVINEVRDEAVKQIMPSTTRLSKTSLSSPIT